MTARQVWKRRTAKRQAFGGPPQQQNQPTQRTGTDCGIARGGGGGGGVSSSILTNLFKSLTTAAKKSSTTTNTTSLLPVPTSTPPPSSAVRRYTHSPDGSRKATAAAAAARSPLPVPRFRFVLRTGKKAKIHTPAQRQRPQRERQRPPSSPSSLEGSQLPPHNAPTPSLFVVDATSAFRLQCRVRQLLHDAQPVGSGISLMDVVTHAARPLAPDVALAAAVASLKNGKQRAGASVDDDEIDGKGLPASWRSFPWQHPRRRVRRDLVLPHRYRYLRALDRLEEEEQQQHSLGLLRLHTWDEVRSKLELCLEFPHSAPPDNEVKDKDTHEQSGRNNGTTTFATSTAIADPTLDAYSRRLQQESLDWVGASELAPSQRLWLAQMQRCAATREDRDGADVTDDDKGGTPVDALANRLREAQLAHTRRRTPAALLRDAEEQEEEARALTEAASAPSVLRPLTDAEREAIEDALYGSGHSSDIVAQFGADTVQRSSIQTLRPGCWLNDEVIHYFCVMLAQRDAAWCQETPQPRRTRRTHFFKSFFVTKLLNEGHADPAKDGTYEYKNVKRWSKNVPGKDIFGLDKVVFPINQSGMHWVCAVLFVQEKRLQFYDSLGGDGSDYLEFLLRYVQDEHLDKKKQPLPDAGEWKLIPCQKNTPRQLNGYDCGVFTCMFADFVSRDAPLTFDQSHVAECRERITLSILQGSALE